MESGMTLTLRTMELMASARLMEKENPRMEGVLPKEVYAQLVPEEEPELCITIVGIPFGRQHFKIAKLALMPFGASIE